MLFDANGKYSPNGRTHQLLTFNSVESGSLPAWLTTTGTDPIVTFNAIGATERGSVTLSTKVATPTIGDFAGLQTMPIVTAQFSEVGFFVHSMQLDSGSTPTNSQILMQAGVANTNGFVYQSDAGNAGKMQIRAASQIISPNLQLMDSINVLKRKNFGVVIRPYTRELFVTTGDPADGGAVVAYVPNYGPSTTAFFVNVYARAAAQRSMSISQVKLRLSQY